MQLKEIIEKIPFLNKTNDVMVCEVDALGMRASVFNRNRDTLTVTLEADAHTDDLVGGIAELVQQLRKQGWRGNQALLLSPAVVQQLIELTIPPKNKLAPQQIAETVRWELEPFLTQQLRGLSIGQILLQNRQIKPEQIQEILSQQEADNTSKNREAIYKPFGEIAVQLRYATQGQVDKALKKQAWFFAANKNANSDDLQCGWATQSPDINPDTKLFSWLAVGMSKPLLRQWQAAFAAQAIKLDSCYPLTGNAIGGLGLAAKTFKSSQRELLSELVFEVHAAQLTGAYLHDGVLKNCQTMLLQPAQALSAISDMALSFGVENLNRVILVDALSQSDGDIKLLADDVQHVLGHPVTILSRLGNSTNLGLKAAAQHFMQQKNSAGLAAVPVSEPLAPLMQRPAVKAGIGAMVILALVGLAEASLQVRTYLIESEKAVVDKDLAKINEAIGRVQGKVDAVKKLKDDIKEKQTEVKKLKESIELLEVGLPNRNDTIRKFLIELNRTVSDDVVIDSIEEDTILGFSITAWAINDKSAQEFVKNLQVAVYPLGYRFKNITVTEQTGRLGLLGSAVHFNATTLNDDIWKASKQNPRSTGTTSNPTNNPMNNPINNSVKAGQ
jgi:hypothetical protein